MQVGSTLDLTIGGFNWLAAGIGNIENGHQFSGTYSVLIDFGAGFDSGSGMFSGFFSEPGNTPNPDWPGGVGLTYTLTGSDFVEWVSGALVFGDPAAAPPGIRSITRLLARVDDWTVRLPGLRRAGLVAIGSAEKPAA